MSFAGYAQTHTDVLKTLKFCTFSHFDFFIFELEFNF